MKILARIVATVIVLTLSAFAPSSASAADTLTTSWQQPREDESLTRPWVGPDFFGNRLLDWRLANGRIECLTGTRNKPMRTLHLLTRTIGDQPGECEISVRTGPVEWSTDAPLTAETWTGFLIGAGGDHVDYRISALCHQWPAVDGGLIAGLNGQGHVEFRRNDIASGRNPRNVDAWPLVEPSNREGDGFTTGQDAPDVVLTLTATTNNDGTCDLTLTATNHATDDLISATTVARVAADLVDGNIALVSHWAPGDSKKGYWFRDWRVSGTKVNTHPDRAFGPIFGAQHTLSRGIMKMTAQLAPLGSDDTATATLQLFDGKWFDVTTETRDADAATVTFRMEPFYPPSDVPYRIVYDLRTERGPERHSYEGTIRKPPTDREEFVIAGLTCHHISAKGSGAWNHSGIWYPHNELVAAVKTHEPDMVYFAGDQLYEGGLAGIVRTPDETAILDYHYHWLRWVWAFRDLTRDVPTVTIPDDHDVYHGNVWGNGGVKAEGSFRFASDAGGYIQSPRFVNMVHRTQTSHLPDPVDPEPVANDISVYFTRMEYANLSFAIIADRQFKSSPTTTIPEANVRNGWFHNYDYDPRDADVPGAVLLGERQLRFLDEWANDWSSGARGKILLSQTIFTNLATLPQDAKDDGVVPGMRQPLFGEYMEGDKIVADADSNGWPQTGRNRALETVRRGFALHIAGDQHLASVVQYGVDGWNNASWAFCLPSIANVWPRRWWPPMEGRNRASNAPPYAGEFEDGFGNPITVHAVANPMQSNVEPSALYDRSPGYGIIRINRRTRDVQLDCWPRWVDPSKPGARQYPGWPMRLNLADNFVTAPELWLPPLRITNLADPVIQVIDQANGSVVYTWRADGDRFQPWVPSEGVYSVVVGDPDRGLAFTVTDLEAGEQDQNEIVVTL